MKKKIIITIIKKHRNNIYTFAVLSKSSLTFEFKKKKEKIQQLQHCNGVTVGKLETMCLIELLISRKPEIETGSYTWPERPTSPHISF